MLKVVRNSVLLLLYLGFWTLLGVYASAQTPRQLVPDGKDVLVDTAYGRSYALLVGINEFKHIPQEFWLKYAVNDVKALKSVLVSDYGFPEENITVLVGKDATREAITDALSQFADRHKIRPEDRILIYFSTHGQTVAIDENGGKMGFLIPYDANIDFTDTSNAPPYLKTCLPMTTVWDDIAPSPARHILIIADACFAGLLAQKRDIAGINPQLLKEWLARRARQVMAASEKDKPSQEFPELGHGAFTYYLLEELKARAAIPGQVFTASELLDSVRKPVVNKTMGDQFPVLGDKDTTGQFLFITAGSGSREAQLHIRTNPMDDAQMVYIPAGEFVMGTSDAQVDALLKLYPDWKRDWFKEEQPQHRVNLDGYWLYKNLVTVGQYQKFCRATGRKMPPEPGGKDVTVLGKTYSIPRFNVGWSKEDHPIVNVSWDDAQAYAKWAGGDLPTEAQWEKGARGTDGRLWPWGNTWDSSKVWCSKQSYFDAGGTHLVGELGVSPYGCTDMAGNVFEWCRDWYAEDYYSKSISKNPPGPDTGTQRVLRGGSWYGNDPSLFRAANRDGGSPSDRNDSRGFRVVLQGF